MVNETTFTAEEAFERSLDYFGGDDLAASTFVSKYSLKQPLKDSEGKTSFMHLEETPNDMHERLTAEFIKIEERYTKPVDSIEIRKALDGFKQIVPGGSVMYGAGNPFVRISLSNCIVIDSPEDSITGIMETGKDMANLFKARCGVGVAIDSLRPDGAIVNNSAGTSTGAWSFADFYSNVCRMIGQNGRRGALMITMNVRHPDIEQFIMMKRDLSKVTGANVSVMIPDEFMQAVKNNDNWELRWPIEPIQYPYKWVTGGTTDWDIYGYPKLIEPRIEHVANSFDELPDCLKKTFKKTIKARDLWYKINESAVKSAEPGIIYWDTYKNNLPANEYPMFKAICVNPCSEIALSPYDSCRLLSICLKNFVKNPFTEKAYFDFVEFEQAVRLSMRLMDDIVDMEIDCIQNIIDNVTDSSEKALWGKLKTAAETGRRTGLGTHGLADCLARLCLKYDSLEAQKQVDTIFSHFRDFAYDESVNLAYERGAFPAFDWELEKNNAFIQRLPQYIKDKMAIYGRRNISLLTMAPTGSVSIVSQCSSGLEPVFMNAYIRRKKINPSDPNQKVDFIDDKGDKWTEYFVFHHNVKDYLDIHPDIKTQWEEIQANTNSTEWAKEITKLLPDYFVTAYDIDPIRRIDIQGAIQKYIDHGISSTINMPAGTTVEQGMELYEKAWEAGLKGVTIYVDGSRAGVLVSKKETKPQDIQDSSAPKRPRELPCDVHHSQIDGQKWTILVGLLNGKPYEIFGGLAEHVTVQRKYATGTIVKRKCQQLNAKGRYSCYDLILDEDEGEIIPDIAVAFNDGNYAAQTRMISLSLRHGVPINYIVEQLGRDINSDFFSFSKVMARILKKYVEDGTVSSENCPECGSKLRFEGGCAYCPQCGSSKCN